MKYQMGGDVEVFEGLFVWGSWSWQLKSRFFMCKNSMKSWIWKKYSHKRHILSREAGL